MRAYIAQCKRTQHGIADGVQQYIGIAVAQRSFMMRYGDAANAQWPPFYQLMKI
jgi:hypothetical protein